MAYNPRFHTEPEPILAYSLIHRECRYDVDIARTRTIPENPTNDDWFVTTIRIRSTVIHDSVPTGWQSRFDAASHAARLILTGKVVFHADTD